MAQQQEETLIVPSARPATGRRTLSGPVGSKRTLIEVALTAIVCLSVYLSFIEVRLTIPDSDLTRVVTEFVTWDMSAYNWREPLYWFSGKLLTRYTDDPWVAIIILDVCVVLLLYFALKDYNLPPIFFLALLLSPLFVLGFNNIHRQLCGLAAWLLVERRTNANGPYKGVVWHAIPFMIHSSAGVLSIIYYFAYAIVRRDIVILCGIAGFALVFSGLYPQVLAALARDGTETNTSLELYLAWAAACAFPIFYASSRVPFIIIFYVVGIFASAGLFVFSGGSSGSRFFMTIITVSSIWVVSRIVPNVYRGKISHPIIVTAIGLLLTLPTFFNKFSSTILLAAFTGKEFFRFM